MAIVSRNASGRISGAGAGTVSTTISLRDITTAVSSRGGLNRSARRRKNRRLARGTETVSVWTMRRRRGRVSICIGRVRISVSASSSVEESPCTPSPTGIRSVCSTESGNGGSWSESGSGGNESDRGGSESAGDRVSAGDTVPGRLSDDDSISARMFFSSRLAVAPPRIERKRLVVRRSLSASSRTMLSRRIVCSESPRPVSVRSESIRLRTVRNSWR
ncbi:unknown [Alistipes sp. CAG:268]|nr:unknown [Alistipes sp. CAG:268]